MTDIYLSLGSNLGDRHTLTRHPFYNKLYQYIKALKTENGPI